MRASGEVWNYHCSSLENKFIRWRRTRAVMETQFHWLFSNNRFPSLWLFKGVAKIFKWTLERASKEGDRMKALRTSAASNLQSCAIKHIIALRPQSNHCQVESRLIIPNTSNNPLDNRWMTPLLLIPAQNNVVCKQNSASFNFSKIHLTLKKTICFKQIRSLTDARGLALVRFGT